MRGIFLREQRKQRAFNNHITASYSYLHSADTENAGLAYHEALKVFGIMSQKSQAKLGPAIRTLYETLQAAHNKRMVSESIAHSHNTVNKLHEELKAMRETSRQIYLEFLLKEREYKNTVLEMTKRKQSIEDARQGLAAALLESNCAEAPKPRPTSKAEVLTAWTAVQRLLQDLDLHLSQGNTQAARLSYESLRSVYKNLTPGQKDQAFAALLPKLRQLANTLEPGF